MDERHEDRGVGEGGNLPFSRRLGLFEAPDDTPWSHMDHSEVPRRCNNRRILPAASRSADSPCNFRRKQAHDDSEFGAEIESHGMRKGCTRRRD